MAKIPQLIELRAGQPVYRGYVLSPSGGWTYLISNAIPDELVIAKIVEQRRDYSIATTHKVLEPSQDRIAPLCSVYGTCGGCHYQHITYSRQVEMKQQVLQDCLRRISKIDPPLITTLCGEQWNYRHRASFKVKEDIVGFYKANSREIVAIRECPLMRPEINDTLHHLTSLDWNGFTGQIEVITGEDTLITAIPEKGSQLPGRIKRQIQEVGLGAKNKQYLTLDLNGGVYTVSHQTFFQANWALNRQVLDFLRNTLNIRGKRVIDLYAGAGNFSLGLLWDAQSVIAYEENQQAIEDARRNARLRGLTNCKFIQSKTEDIKPLIGVDLAIVNPPRTGLTRRAIEVLIALKAEELVYMSCDPATFSRDIGRLKRHYDIRSLLLIDFFPQTYHIETLGILKKGA